MPMAGRQGSRTLYYEDLRPSNMFDEEESAESAEDEGAAVLPLPSRQTSRTEYYVSEAEEAGVGWSPEEEPEECVPALPLPSRQTSKTEYYVAVEEEEAAEAEASTGNGSPQPQPPHSTVYYIDGEEDTSTAFDRPRPPSTALDRPPPPSHEPISEGTVRSPPAPAEGRRSSGDANLSARLLTICLDKERPGQIDPGKTVVFEARADDTASSIALDLVEELQIEASAHVLTRLVAQVEEAMARAEEEEEGAVG